MRAQIEFITAFNYSRTTKCTLTPTSREQARQKIAADTANFLARGKKIKIVPVNKFVLVDETHVQILKDGSLIQPPQRKAA